MPLYDQIEYSSDCSETTWKLCFYSKNEAINFNADITTNNNFKSFEWKAKLLRNTETAGANKILKKFNNYCPIKV